MSDNSTQKDQGITISTGIKLGIGISIGVLIVLFGILLIGTFVLRQAVAPPNLPDTTNAASDTKQNKESDEDWAAKFAALSAEEKLQKRLAGVEGMNKNASLGCVVTLTGENQDIITINCPLGDYPKEAIRAFATSLIDSFLSGEQTIKEMIALDVKSLVVTDGKKTWTKDLRTGTLTEQEAK